MLPNRDPSKLQSFLDCSVDSVAMLGMRLVTSNCQTLLQEWIGLKPNLVLAGHVLGDVDGLNYLARCILPSVYTSNEVSSNIQKVRLAFVDLWHQWLRHNIWLSTKGAAHFQQ